MSHPSSAMKTTLSLVLLAGSFVGAPASAADLPASVAVAADAAGARNDGAPEASAKPAKRAKAATSTAAERAAPTSAEKDVWAVPLFQNAKPLHEPR
jgi:hypothetical protein